ncbi:hypothetical protein [Polyangium mundeleinium]|uniref:Secreted protein n=1 Tax=Polyangium mundeleinium TaxID=2995306 RepID=A0ABT5EJ40_9BACT|nr:hypothetical protein [Polyangium mundeleinium]MDC0740770.1 hypothetical protein [Polyangium mundeleinium]
MRTSIALLFVAPLLSPLGCSADVHVNRCDPEFSMELKAVPPSNASLTGQCLPAAPPLLSSGESACAVIVAEHVSATCACQPAAARVPVAPEHEEALMMLRDTDLARELDWNCFCEVPQLSGAAAEGCRTDPSDPPVVDDHPVHGFCYIDPGHEPPIGNPELLAACPAEMPRALRFVGTGKASSSALASGSHVAVVCPARVCAGESGD